MNERCHLENLSKSFTFQKKKVPAIQRKNLIFPSCSKFLSKSPSSYASNFDSLVLSNGSTKFSEQALKMFVFTWGIIGLFRWLSITSADGARPMHLLSAFFAPFRPDCEGTAQYLEVGDPSVFRSHQDLSFAWLVALVGCVVASKQPAEGQKVHFGSILGHICMSLTRMPMFSGQTN